MQLSSHIHALIVSGVFRVDGSFVTLPLFQENVLRELFEANVFKLLVCEGLITAELIAKMRTWRHSGFHVYAGPTIAQKEDAVIKLIYESDPLLCPKCHTQMTVISIIKNGAVIDKILDHLQYKFDVLPLPARPPPPEAPACSSDFPLDPSA